MDDRAARSGGSGGRSGRPGSERRAAPRRGAARTAAPPASSGRRRASAAPRRPGRYGLVLVKVAFAMASLLVFALAGYGWSTFQDLHQGLSTTDVIGSSGPPTPDKATDILLVGLDSRTDAHDKPLPRQVLAQLRAGDNEGELTDTMILVRIPNDGRRAVAISLPRDLEVELPEGYGTHKLNSAFIRAKNATAERLTAASVDPALVRTQSIAAGRKLLLEAVKDLTGVGIDHYAEVNLLGFALLTDAVGGVPVCLKAPVHDRFSGANFPAGPQLISGPDALAFVRQRHGLPRGDLDRIVRQQAYLASLANKVLSAGTLASPTRIRQLVNAAQQSLVLDEGFDILDFATRMQGLSAGNVSFETVPVLGDGESDTDGAVLKVDPAAVRAFVAQAADPSSTIAQPAPARSMITVEVFNAAAVTGLAASVSERLTEQGFLPGTVGNSPARTNSVVRYPAGGEEAGRLVADTLGNLPVEEDPKLDAGTIQVYLGKTYSGPGRTKIGGAAFLPRSPATATSPAALSPSPAPPPRPPMMGGTVPCVA